jgi:isocitrate lyase
VSGPRVLVIGLDPEKLDGWDPAPVLAGLARSRNAFAEHGIQADWCLFAPDDDAEEAITTALAGGTYACVVIGGGIRTHEPLLPLFEAIVNLVHRQAPDAAIAFNSAPDDCATAALRRLR